jgi:hypothetical protein
VSQPEQSVQQVLEENRDAIMALPNVVGTGISRCGDGLCIRVLVSKSCAGLEKRLDELLGPVPFVVETTEPLQALPAED